MPTFARYAVLLSLLMLLVGPGPVLRAAAQDRLGIVLLHGKGGLPQQLTPMAGVLSVHGFLTEQPEMCWSRNRIYDRLYTDCLREIEASAERQVRRNRRRGAR